MDSSCMEALFITVDGYLTLLHSLGKKLLMDIATDREYRAAFEREEAFWLQQLIDVLTHCKICGYLLPRSRSRPFCTGFAGGHLPEQLARHPVPGAAYVELYASAGAF